eukprot:3604764-Rhodomonas_salina.3
MSGTEAGCAANRRNVVLHSTSPRSVRVRSRISLCACYAMSGTDLADATTRNSRGLDEDAWYVVLSPLAGGYEIFGTVSPSESAPGDYLIAYTATKSGQYTLVSATPSAYVRAMQYQPVLTQRMTIPVPAKALAMPYLAKSGTDLASTATRLRACYANSGTGRARAGIFLRVCYAKSGTDLVYAAAGEKSLSLIVPEINYNWGSGQLTYLPTRMEFVPMPQPYKEWSVMSGTKADGTATIPTHYGTGGGHAATRLCPVLNSTGSMETRVLWAAISYQLPGPAYSGTGPFVPNSVLYQSRDLFCRINTLRSVLKLHVVLYQSGDLGDIHCDSSH